MSATRAIWYVAGTKRSPRGILYLHCHVKPGASKSREGIAAISDDSVELVVAAQAREGEANKAVVKVLSEVLGLPKSDLQITQGHKSRNKTVAASGSWIDSSGEECITQAQERLCQAMEEP